MQVFQSLSKPQQEPKFLSKLFRLFMRFLHIKTEQINNLQSWKAIIIVIQKFSIIKNKFLLLLIHTFRRFVEQIINLLWPYI